MRLWIITFLNYKDDNLKGRLEVIKRQILGFLFLHNVLEFLGKLLSKGGGERTASAVRLARALFLSLLEIGRK